MDNPDNWTWFWLVLAVGLGIGEILAAGSFFLAPIAAGALAAFATAMFGGAVFLQWLLFLVVSGATFAALRPLARRLDASIPSDGIGANYLIGARARVIEAIPADGDGLGLVRVDRQEWRAESLDGVHIEVGAMTHVVEVRGTRVIVVPAELTSSDADDTPPDVGPTIEP